MYIADSMEYQLPSVIVYSWAVVSVHYHNTSLHVCAYEYRAGRMVWRRGSVCQLMIIVVCSPWVLQASKPIPQMGGVGEFTQLPLTVV